MRRRNLHHLWRLLFNITAAVSAILLVAVVVAWVRSYTGEAFQCYYYARRTYAGNEVRTDQCYRSAALTAGYVCLWTGWRDMPPREPERDPPDEGWTFNHTPWTPRPPATAPRGAVPSRWGWRFWNGFGIYTRARDQVFPPTRLPKDRALWQFTEHYREISIPIWMPAVLTAILPLCWTRRAWRERRRRQARASGRCVACGYDMRATSERCPECGKVASEEPPVNPPMHRTGPAV